MWVYIVNILIYFDTERYLLKHSAIVCDKLKEAKLSASRTKSKILPSSMDILGHIIDDE